MQEFLKIVWKKEIQEVGKSVGRLSQEPQRHMERTVISGAPGTGRGETDGKEVGERGNKGQDESKMTPKLVLLRFIFWDMVSHKKKLLDMLNFHPTGHFSKNSSSLCRETMT